MIKQNKDIFLKKEELENFDEYCEECKREDVSVSQNFILSGFKICNSCKISKTIFPVQLIVLIGKVFILLTIKDIEIITIIKNDKKIIPNDLIFDFKLSTSFVEIIKLANIQN